jgi:hypothetical protein
MARRIARFIRFRFNDARPEQGAIGEASSEHLTQ